MRSSALPDGSTRVSTRGAHRGAKSESTTPLLLTGAHAVVRSAVKNADARQTRTRPALRVCFGI